MVPATQVNPKTESTLQNNNSSATATAASTSTKPNLIQEIENKQFANFVKAFEEGYRNPLFDEPYRKDLGVLTKAEAEIREALKKFNTLLLQEIETLAKSPDQSIAKADYILLARKYPLILLFSMDITDKPYVYPSLGCLFDSNKFKYRDVLSNLEPKPLIQHLNDSVKINSSNFKINNPECQIPIALIIFPELKVLPSVLKELVSHRKFMDYYAYYQMSNAKISTELKQTLILELIRNYRDSFSSPAYDLKNNKRIFFSIYLNYLFSQNLHIEACTDGLFQWFQHFPWELMTESQIFIFDYLEKAKDPSLIRDYLQTTYPNLVYHYLRKGYFFIAEQLMAFGLEEPQKPIETFLQEAFLEGLKHSQEIRRYHATCLLAYQLGLVPRKAISGLDNLMDRSQADMIQKQALDTIPQLIKYYVKNFTDPENPLILQKGRYQALNHLMLSFERDYALAVSSIYNLPILNPRSADGMRSVKSYRGVALAKTPRNRQLIQHWINFGHRPDYYAFLGHAYNRTVVAHLEEGPRFNWSKSANIMSTASSIEHASYYAQSSSFTDGYLLILKYKIGQPIFTGHVHHQEPSVNEFEIPVCLPQSMEGIYKVDFKEPEEDPEASDSKTKTEQDSRKVIIKEAYYGNGQSKASATLSVGEYHGEARKQVKEKAEKGEESLQSLLFPHRGKLSEDSFKSYVGSYQLNNLIISFRNNFNTLSAISERMLPISRLLNSLDRVMSHWRFHPSLSTYPHHIKINGIILDYLFEERSREEIIIAEQLSYTLNEIDAIPKTTHESVATALRIDKLSPEQMLDCISNHYPMVKQLFLSTAQVWEGYSVQEHTLMVIANLKKHQALPQYAMTLRSVRNFLPNIDILFPLCIVLHDIGKSIGDRDNQTQHTVAIVEKLLSLWNFSGQEIAFARILLNHDLLGSFFKEYNPLESSAQSLALASVAQTLKEKLKASGLGIKFKYYFYLQMLYYLSDMGSYPVLQRLIKPSPIQSPFHSVIISEAFQRLTFACQWHLPLYNALATSTPVLFQYAMAKTEKGQHPFDIILDYCANRRFEHNTELTLPNPNPEASSSLSGSLTPSPITPSFSNYVSNSGIKCPYIFEILKPGTGNTPSVRFYISLELYYRKKLGETENYIAVHLKENDQWRKLKIVTATHTNSAQNIFENDFNFELVFDDPLLESLNQPTSDYMIRHYNISLTFKNSKPNETYDINQAYHEKNGPSLFYPNPAKYTEPSSATLSEATRIVSKPSLTATASMK